ncbi:DUF3311 domain-containing protein [Paraburkholderia sp. SOS3]|uniref:DUF3311 domain-containing protein n=1 Tax=Paraburkholderia sp. SOS3 TaxID=1926494 RepID=UPI0009473E0F|nr:DUF3311 domain-containing protein [Paraburkholderia sp. SOS3]APR35691.1 hypothetical protein BTO02_09965 [Paraburkholderia sp. SOS3]
MKKINVLAAIPCIAIFAGIFFGNRVTPYVLGVPFLLAWMMGCAMLTTVALLIIDSTIRDEHDETNGETS